MVSRPNEGVKRQVIGSYGALSDDNVFVVEFICCPVLSIMATEEPQYLASLHRVQLSDARAEFLEPLNFAISHPRI